MPKEVKILYTHKGVYISLVFNSFRNSVRLLNEEGQAVSIKKVEHFGGKPRPHHLTLDTYLCKTLSE